MAFKIEKEKIVYEKTTPLIVLFLFTIQFVICQNISHSASLTIKDNHSVSFNSGGITRTNSFYRSFNYHPNPVKDKLYMNAQENISSVSLYNMLGQKLKEIQPSQFDAELD